MSYAGLRFRRGLLALAAPNSAQLDLDIPWTSPEPSSSDGGCRGQRKDLLVQGGVVGGRLRREDIAGAPVL